MPSSGFEAWHINAKEARMMVMEWVNSFVIFQKEVKGVFELGYNDVKVVTVKLWETTNSFATWEAKC